MRWPRVATAVLAAMLLAAAPASAAKPATLSGKLTGAKLPAKGRGVVPLHAMRLSDGRVVAGGYASASGRFTLKAPPGSYALLAAVVPFRGRKPPIQRVADFVTAKAGKRIRLKPTLKKRKRHRAHRRKQRATGRRGARPAWVQVDYPAIWIKEFQTPDGDLAVLRKGLTGMLITDVVTDAAHCGAIVVERARLAEVIAEIDLQQSRQFDPDARVRTGRLIASNATITGSLTVSGNTMTLTATYHDERSGRRTTVSVSQEGTGIFELEQRLAKKLNDVICQHTPRTYAGTFSGTAKSTLNDYTISWHGSVVIGLVSEHGDPPSGAPPGDYASYVVERGSVHVTLDGTRGVCAAHGEADIPLVTGVPSGLDAVQLSVPKPYYSLTVSPRGDEVVPYTESGFGCQKDPAYPLAGIPFVFTPTPLQSADGNLTASTTWDPSSYSHLSFSFSFAPAS